MYTILLNERDLEKIGDLVHAFDDHEAWIRFWNKNSVQLDGDFTLTDLEKLVEIMRRLK